jgi:hypothetical protein
MVRQEFEAADVGVLLAAVDLDAALVIDVHVLLLRRGEELPRVRVYKTAHIVCGQITT